MDRKHERRRETPRGRRVQELQNQSRRMQEYTEDKAKKQRQKRRRRTWILRFKLVVGVLLVMAVGYVGWDRFMDSRTLGCRISVSGTDVSWLTEEQAAEKIEKKFAGIPLEFVEEGEKIYRVPLTDAGYSLDHESLVQQLRELRGKRRPCYSLFEKHKNYEVPCPVNVQEEQKQAAFAAANFDGKKERTGSENAYIQYNEKKNRYEIAAHRQGNLIDETRLLAAVQEFLDDSFAKELLKSPLTFTMDEKVYQAPEVGSEQEALVNRMEELNAKLDNLARTSITYTFGEVTEVLNADDFGPWFTKEADDIVLDEDAVWQYIYELAAKYDTIYVSRFFTSSYGYEVQIDNNEYGYQIDQNAEFAQLVEDLESGEEIEREPVYSHSGNGRNGDDDLLGNYIEVDLSAQHMWLYKDGQMILESDIISGRPVGINNKTGAQEDWSTYRGAYPIAYKESPATLSSDIYGYETPVQYWMPFVEGQGFHDASWQSAFGGTTYQYAGSHGCINLPTYVAAELYDNITQGYAVLIY